MSPMQLKPSLYYIKSLPFLYPPSSLPEATTILNLFPWISLYCFMFVCLPLAINAPILFVSKLSVKASVLCVFFYKLLFP